MNVKRLLLTIDHFSRGMHPSNWIGLPLSLNTQKKAHGRNHNWSELIFGQMSWSQIVLLTKTPFETFA